MKDGHCDGSNEGENPVLHREAPQWTQIEVRLGYGENGDQDSQVSGEADADEELSAKGQRQLTKYPIADASIFQKCLVHNFV